MESRANKYGRSHIKLVLRRRVVATGTFAGGGGVRVGCRLGVKTIMFQYIVDAGEFSRAFTRLGVGGHVFRLGRARGLSGGKLFTLVAGVKRSVP